MDNENETEDILVCSLCGSRHGPFKNIKQGGNDNAILGCACTKCQELPDEEWNRAIRILIHEEVIRGRIAKR